MSSENLQNPEFLEKLKSAKTTEEFMALVQEEGIELTDEQLKAVSGGAFTCNDVVCWDVCPFLDLLEDGFLPCNKFNK